MSFFSNIFKSKGKKAKKKKTVKKKDPPKPIPDAPLEDIIPRKYITVDLGDDSDDSEEDESKNLFSIGSHNVLADRFVSFTKYNLCPKEYIKRTYRIKKLVQEMTYYNFDIFCLQELSHRNYDFLCLEENFGKVYKSQFKRITVEKPWLKKTDDKKDEKSVSVNTSEYQKIINLSKEGLGIFWKDEKFELVKSESLEFNQIAYIDYNIEEEKNEELKEKKQKLLRNLVHENHNVGLVCVLRNKQTKTLFVLGTVHLHYRSNDYLSQAHQLEFLFKKVKELSDELNISHYIVSGDFNLTKENKAYEFIEKGKFKEDVSKFDLSPYNVVKRNPIHELELLESYPEKHKPFTHRGFKSIDYIFRNEKVKVHEVLEINKEWKNFPNKDIYSDHLLLGAKVELS